jgi:hypothetical protein
VSALPQADASAPVITCQQEVVTSVFGQKLHTNDLREKVTVSLTMLSHGRPVGQSCETRSSREPHHWRRGTRRADCASGSACLRLDESSSKELALAPEINLSADSVVGIFGFTCKPSQT